MPVAFMRFTCCVLGLESDTNADPIGKLIGDARSHVVGPERRALSIKCARPVRILKCHRKPERRVDRDAEPTADHSVASWYRPKGRTRLDRCWACRR